MCSIVLPHHLRRRNPEDVGSPASEAIDERSVRIPTDPIDISVVEQLLKPPVEPVATLI
jgi:hypothetical protein